MNKINKPAVRLPTKEKSKITYIRNKRGIVSGSAVIGVP